MFGRKQLAQLCFYYEYPSIIFIGEEIDEDCLSRICNSQLTYEEIAGSISKIYLMHRNFEPNVLWLLKSTDMNWFF